MRDWSGFGDLATVIAIIERKRPFMPAMLPERSCADFGSCCGLKTLSLKMGDDARACTQTPTEADFVDFSFSARKFSEGVLGHVEGN